MAEFKCISCGAVKESAKPCSCAICGYRMFEAPYERAEVLRKEIIRFIAYLRPLELPPDVFRVFRKTSGESDTEEKGIVFMHEDNAHFPDFSTIQGYVCASTKTEMFHERLNRSVQEIKDHIHKPYRQDYQVTLEGLQETIEDYKVTLEAVADALDMSLDLPQIELPQLGLAYSESPNEELLGMADEVLGKLLELSEKIKKFIKQNNIYGTAYQKKPKTSFKPSAAGDYLQDLRDCSAHLSEVVARKYTVDIFSDGSEELSEMLQALWEAIEALMTLPILVKKSVYTFPDGTIAEDEQVNKELLARINNRYAEIDEIIYAFDFLADKSEDELFGIYDRMIELDEYGVLVSDKSELMRIGENEKKLNELIGLSQIKDSIKKIKAYALANNNSGDLNLHMCFLGNPGSGKTEVARFIAGILYENKILPTKKIVEVDRSGLVSQYFGATAEKTSQVIASAMGGVLFIDEAYALGNKGDHETSDYGKEAIDTLNKAMEDHRGKFCVILAGYKNEMQEMLSTNPGFRSRIQFTLDFPNYSREELRAITEMMLKARKYTMGNAAMERILDITDVKRKEANFANAREIRNILDQVIMCQNVRCIGTEDKELGLVDVNQYIQDVQIKLPTTGEGAAKKLLSGEEELEQLIGLAAVKRMIKKIKAYAKRNRGEADFNMHMCFYGNPGTGKTEVARILSRILYEAGVLAEAKLVETDGQGLIGKVMGETAPKTEAKIKEAMNGVLFIDEAYTLAGAGSYGEEAMAVLLKSMEDYRGQLCVVLAGYKEEMKNMLSANPGFESRIQFALEFPDYSREELGEIARQFLAGKKYDMEEAALERVLDVADYYRKKPNFANARTLRNILDQVLMNQNLRTEDLDNDNTVVLADVEDYLTDEGIDLSNPDAGKRTIGFV